MKKVGKAIKEDVAQTHLPEDVVIDEILPRLPVKSLCICKTVSKKWYSCITSPNFILRYTQKPLCPHLSAVFECLIIQSGQRYYLYYCDPNDDNVPGLATYSNSQDNLVKLDVDFYVSQSMILVGSCNGLVCSGDYHGEYFILWNPSIAQYHRYYIPNYQDLIFNGHKPCHVNWGFGYVSSQDDYKVVCWFTHLQILYVFSLRTNSWKRIECGLGDVFADRNGRLLKEKFYWSARLLTSSEIWYRKIFVFDFELETLEVLPIDLGTEFVTVMIMGGYLALGVWSTWDNAGVLKKIGIVRSLENVVDVCLCKEFNLRLFDDLIGFTRTGKIFLASYNPPSLLLVDDTSKRSLATLEGFFGSAGIDSYVPSMISPCPPAVFDGVEQEERS